MNFLKSTLIFCAFGLFIPGFTAIIIIGMQMLIVQFGVKCENSWSFIWLFSGAGIFALPYLFIKNLIKNSKQNYQTLKIKLLAFNFLEYIFIQTALTPMMTDSDTLCNVTDGQNGLELVFTAWFALPVLIVLSYVFKLAYNE